MRTADRDQFHDEGYVVLRGFVPPDEVGGLRRAIEVAGERDEEPNELSLRSMRFASNLFHDSAVLREFLASRRVVDLVAALLGPDVWVRWDQAVWKGPEAPVFPWHQDNGYTNLDAMHLQLWLALTPMDGRNGGLLVAPGGHRRVAPHDRVGAHVRMTTPPNPVAISADPGDAIAFSSYLPHATTGNVTGDDRLAYVAEFLPIAVADRSVRPPHLVVARGGRPSPSFEDLSAAWDLDRAIAVTQPSDVHDDPGALRR